MTDVSDCRVCKKKLVGDVGKILIDVGNFVYLVTRETFDCNWRRCNGCKDVLCKSCYAQQYAYCCDEDRIVSRERAQAIADRELQKCQKFTRLPDTSPDSGGANQNQNKNQQEEYMSDFKIVYLIVERGIEPNRQVFWRSAGSAFICRDGSINVKLDIHPGLTFNIRDPKSNGERIETEYYQHVGNGHGAVPVEVNGTGPVQAKSQSRKQTEVKDDDIPF